MHHLGLFQIIKIQISKNWLFVYLMFTFLAKTQHYDASSGKVGKRFVEILSVQIDRFCAKNSNDETVAVFQSIILQRAQGVNNYVQIRKLVLF